MGIKAVIFDLDGTLVDSIDGIAYSMNKVLSVHGFPVRDMETYKTLVGNGVRMLVKKALPAKIKDEAELDRCHSEMLEEYSKNWDHGMTVYEGIYELLKYLDELGIDYAVNTNKVEDVSKLIIKRFFADFRFFSVEGGKPGKPHKPDPAGAKCIADQLGALPGQCVFLGDSEVDIMTAKNAGMIQVSAAWGFRSLDDLRTAGAGHIIKEPMELIDIMRHL